MPWVRLDDSFHAHPKVLAAGLKGAGLYAMALSYCGDLLTDGFVPDAWVRAYGTVAVARQLVEVGLWEKVEGGYVIPDFNTIGNPTRQEVLDRREEISKKRSEAGAKGAASRWHGKQMANAISDERQKDAPSPVPSPDPITTGSQPAFKDLDDERRRELDRIYAWLEDADSGTAGVLASYARQLPFGAVAKVRESVESRPARVKSGWVVNALRSEIRERAA